MRLLILVFFLSFFAASLSGQTDKKNNNQPKSIPNSVSALPDTIPPYKKNPHIPAFRILLSDSSVFTKAQLPISEYTAIIYFSPDCSHCQYTVKDIVKHMDSLQNVFFVFVAYKSVSIIKEFIESYHLGQFSNIRVGHDPVFYVPSFYRVSFTPFVAVYNKSGNLIQVYDPPNRNAMEVGELIDLVNPKK